MIFGIFIEENSRPEDIVFPSGYGFPRRRSDLNFSPPSKSSSREATSSIERFKQPIRRNERPMLFHADFQPQNEVRFVPVKKKFFVLFPIILLFLLFPAQYFQTRTISTYSRSNATSKTRARWWCHPSIDRRKRRCAGVWRGSLPWYQLKQSVHWRSGVQQMWNCLPSHLRQTGTCCVYEAVCDWVSVSTTGTCSPQRSVHYCWTMSTVCRFAQIFFLTNNINTLPVF